MAKKKSLDDLGKGDLVLIPHYFSGEQVPGRMVLARVLKLDEDTQFYSTALAVLHQFDRSQVLPRVSRNYEGSQYVFEKGVWGEIHGWCVQLAPSVANGQVYIGLKEVLAKLEKTPGYAPHAASLRAATSKRATSAR